MINKDKNKKNDAHHKVENYPTHFANLQVDQLSKHLTAFGNTYQQRITYMGPRFFTANQAFQSYSDANQHQQTLNQPQLYGQAEIKKFGMTNSNHKKQNHKGSRNGQYRLFNGMNPTIDKAELKFDSNFECGNLDLVVKRSELQYDLIMRVDSNTKGNTCWFFFKIYNFICRQKYKFNIVNFAKKISLYQKGMGLRVFKSSTKQWSMHPVLKYETAEIEYHGKEAEDTLYFNKGRCRLQFQYEFDKCDSYVYFSFSFPYSYSLLQHRLSLFQSKCKDFVVDWSNLSSGGLSIPVITVQNQKTKTTERPSTVCMIIGRLHPGETQSSWVLDGFLQSLSSEESLKLRESVVFKIVPMVNVDGVVLGNFRAGVSGRDLNRYFNESQVYPQIDLVMSLSKKCKPQIFLDFHGHSSRKNVFTYGPDYSLEHKHFINSRVFPKLISRSHEAFRYYSCSYAISQNKQTTARAIMLRQNSVSFAYTIQTSVFAYGSKKAQTIFDCSQYKSVGKAISQSLYKFYVMIIENQLKNKLDNYAFKKLKLTKQQRNQNKKIINQIIYEKNELKQKNQINQQDDQSSNFDSQNQYSQKQLKNIFKNQDSFKIQKKLKQKKQQKNQNKQFQIKTIKKTKTENKIKNNDYQNLSGIIKLKSQFNKNNKSKSIQSHHFQQPIQQQQKIIQLDKNNIAKKLNINSIKYSTKLLELNRSNEYIRQRLNEENNQNSINKISIMYEKQHSPKEQKRKQFVFLNKDNSIGRINQRRFKSIQIKRQVHNMIKPIQKNKEIRLKRQNQSFLPNIIVRQNFIQENSSFVKELIQYYQKGKHIKMKKSILFDM